MIEWVWFVIAAPILVISGYFLALRAIAKDTTWVRLKEDEVIIKKPKEGLVLIAVPPSLMGKLEIEGGNTYDPYEARRLYRKK